MRPKDLIAPYSWAERRVVLHQGILFLPEFIEHGTYSLPHWSDPVLFGNENPIEVEYCSGNGHWIIEKARREPHRNFIAIERRFERVRCIWSKRENQHLTNLLILCGEGYAATKEYFPSESISQIYVNFPDPWPKNRHAKNRLLDLKFAHELHRVLKESGRFILATDDLKYALSGSKEMLSQGGFEPITPYPHYITDPEGYGSSLFEKLWRSKGRTIYHIEFAKRQLLVNQRVG